MIFSSHQQYIASIFGFHSHLPPILTLNTTNFCNMGDSQNLQTLRAQHHYGALLKEERNE